MAFRLGPGGQVVLVLLGLFLVYAAVDRAGVLPPRAPHVFPARAPQQERQPTQRRLTASDFAWALPDAPCRLPLRVVTTQRVAAASLWPQEGVLAVDVVDTPADVAAHLKSGAAGGAVLSVSELAGQWGGLKNLEPHVARILTSGGDLGILSERVEGRSGLDGAHVAAVPGSAAEFLVLGSAARTGTTPVLVPAGSPQDAASAADRGEVEAAAAPLQVIFKRSRTGHGSLVDTPAPLDPVVLVLAAQLASCAGDPAVVPRLTGPAEGRAQRARALFPDPTLDVDAAVAATHFGGDPSQVAAAWDAAVRVRAARDVPSATALLLPGAR